MRIVQISVGVVGVAALVCLTVTPLYAGQHGRPVVAAQPHGHGAPSSHPTTKSTPPTTAGTTAAGHSPVAERIGDRPQLVSRLQPLLPPGMTLQQAAAGFRNQGQFIAALHVAHNLNIPFAQLKAEMTGKNHESLGPAIHELRPTAHASQAAKRAESEAKADLEAAGTPKNGDHDDRR